MTPVRRAAARAPRILAVAMVPVMLGLAACSGEEGLVVIRPEIQTNPEPGSIIRFDEVVVGGPEGEPRIIEVTNVGEGPLVIESATIEGANAELFRVSSTPGPLAPNQTGEIFIRFSQADPGEFEARLTVRSNDPNNASLDFTLVGPARESCAIAVSPGSQKFLLGEVRDITITAVTTYECEIVRLFTDESLFEIVDAPELPFDIAAGGSQTIQVRYIRVPRTQGIPVREFRVKESEGQEVLVTLEGEPPVQDCFSVFPDQIIFPNTIVGLQETRFVTVRNRCGREASITAVTIGDGYYFYDVDGDAYPQVVPPLGTTQIAVTYTPFSPSGDSGNLYISTNDALNPRFTVRLYGEASIPGIDAFPQTVNFGTVVYKNPQGAEMRSECASRSLFVQVYSTGGAPLTVDQLEIDSDGDQLFIVTGVTIDGVPVVDINQPMVVPPEKEMRVSVQFFPVRSMPTDHQGTLIIHHNADQTGSATTEITLVGMGKEDGLVTDTFEQLEGPKVDILWVIDDSCSMYDEQARLIQNLSQFVSYADTQAADYQMAVTDTDGQSRNAGKFERCFPHPAVIGSDYLDSAARQEAFECTFDVGTSGVGIEAGLAAAKKALEKAQDPLLSPNVNRGFLRDDANLAIVVMSDEDDQSLESNDVLRDYFWSVKGYQRDRVSLHAIAGPVTEACQTGPFNAVPGVRYSRMAMDLGGIFFNICLQDWQPVLTQLGLDVFVPLDEWTLSQAADPNSMVVTVDGIAVPFDPNDGYTYDPVLNTIKFHGAALPVPGAQIVASYTGLCRP